MTTAPSTKVMISAAKQPFEVDLAWAKPGCRHCHGTGWMGMRLINGGKTRERIVCACVAKEYAKRKRQEKKSAVEDP